MDEHNPSVSRVGEKRSWKPILYQIYVLSLKEIYGKTLKFFKGKLLQYSTTSTTRISWKNKIKNRDKEFLDYQGFDIYHMKKIIHTHFIV